MSQSYVDFIYMLIDDALISDLCCKFWRKQMVGEENRILWLVKANLLFSGVISVLFYLCTNIHVSIKTQGRMAVSVLHESYSLPGESFQSVQICKSSNPDWEKWRGMGDLSEREPENVSCPLLSTHW